MSTQKKCNIDEITGLALLRRHFGLSNETYSSLKEMLKYSKITNNRCRFRKTSYGSAKCLAEFIDFGNKFNNGEKASINGKLSNVIASTFIIDKDMDKLFSYVKSHYKSRYDFFEFEDIKDSDYVIAYD